MGGSRFVESGPLVDALKENMGQMKEADASAQGAANGTVASWAVVRFTGTQGAEGGEDGEWSCGDELGKAREAIGTIRTDRGTLKTPRLARLSIKVAQASQGFYYRHPWGERRGMWFTFYY
jgi:hypothetical protein